MNLNPWVARVLGGVAFLAAGLVPVAGRAADAERPDIILILADDLGWSDLGCYGNPWFATPHLDALAAQGVRFTQGYSPAPICSASRAGTLTGKTPARLNFEFVTKEKPGHQAVSREWETPAFTLNLPLEERTIAERLRDDAGYRTAFFGKWHLSQHYQRYLGWSPTHGPANQGFDVAEEDFGSHPYGYWNDRSKRTFDDALKPDEFPEDGVTQRAIRFLSGKHEKPFFLMVSHFYVHTPVHTRLEWLHDSVAQRIPADHPRREALAHYGAMVETLDHQVGVLLEGLKAAGREKDALVVFTSDNGGHPEYAGNAPLRGSKWNLYEGGIRVPFIVRWPGHVPAGEVCEIPVTSLDLLPAFAGLAGISLGGNDLQALDGSDILPWLKDPGKPAPERQLVWHFPYFHPETGYGRALESIGVDDGYTSKTLPQSAIRRGNEKLVQFHTTGTAEYFDLAVDPSESRSLASAATGGANRLRNDLMSYLQSVGARFPIKAKTDKLTTETP